MKKTIFLTLVLISLIILTIRFASSPLEKFLETKAKSGIKILSVPEGIDVYLDDQLVGKTPFEDSSLEAKEYLVKIKSKENVWQSKIFLSAGTLSVVNRELLEASTSAGEVLTLDRGKGLFVTSWPTGAEVELDGKSSGKTPIGVDILPGEYTIILSQGGYLKRSIKVSVPDGFRLNLNVDLALSELNLTDFNSAPITTTPIVIVKATPTGFLRVRNKPSLLGVEIGRVNPGDELVLLEEGPSWDRVKLSDGKEGYVSVAYVQKKNQTPK